MLSLLRRTALSVDIDHKILHGIPILSLLQTLYESGLPRFASLSRVYLKTGNVADSVKRPAVRVCWQFSDIPRRMMICVSSGAAVFMPTGLASYKQQDAKTQHMTGFAISTASWRLAVFQ